MTSRPPKTQGADAATCMADVCYQTCTAGQAWTCTAGAAHSPQQHPTRDSSSTAGEASDTRHLQQASTPRLMLSGCRGRSQDCCRRTGQARDASTWCGRQQQAMLVTASRSWSTAASVRHTTRASARHARRNRAAVKTSINTGCSSAHQASADAHHGDMGARPRYMVTWRHPQRQATPWL